MCWWKKNANPAEASDFEEVWRRVLAHAGEEFYIPKGGFTYGAYGTYVISSRASGTRLTKANFKKAYENLNVLTPTEFSHTIIGSSYVKAILTDERIASGKR